MANKFTRFQKIRWAVLILIAIGIVVLALMQRREGLPRSLPMLGSVPDFSLTGYNGQQLTHNDLVGRITVVDFIFTRCAGICPVMTHQMRKLQDAFVQMPDVRFLSITVDPEYDTPEVLRKYAHAAGASPHRWMFLTGDKANIHQLARKGFRLGVEETGGTEDEPIIHSSMFVLVDRQGRIRGYYNGLEKEAVERLMGDIKTLVRNGKER